jgi:LysM repeat protein
MPSAFRLFISVAMLLGCLGLSGCVPSSEMAADEEKEPHFLEGRSRVNSMDYDGAIQSFENALIANPKSASAHFELGWLYDQRKNEPATAIYHYGRFLDAHTSGEKADRARTRIVACKQELARTVALAPVSQSLQKEFDQLTEENRRLREENERWRAYFLRQSGQSSAAAPVRPPPVLPKSTPVVVVVKNPAANTNPVEPSTAPTSAQESGTSKTPVASHSVALKTHTVKNGETPLAIAKKYNVRVETLIAANPRLDARRMQIGQTLNIPVN